MNAKDAIAYSLSSTQQMLGMCLADLSDADLTVRPVPGANTIAWQLGHLISSEAHLCAELPGAAYPKLPVGFRENYSKDTAKGTPPGGYLSKNAYLELFNSVRGATLATLKKMSDAELEKPNDGPMKDFAPNAACLLLMNANHVMMHFGQFSVVRRLLNKPVLF